jgi:AraC-like DNA-binding protein
MPNQKAQPFGFTEFRFAKLPARARDRKGAKQPRRRRGRSEAQPWIARSPAPGRGCAQHTFDIWTFTKQGLTRPVNFFLTGKEKCYMLEARLAMINPSGFNRVLYETSIQVRLYDNTENENYPLHWHSAVEIIMPIKENYEVRNSKGIYTLRENDILIMPPCELHSLSVPPGAERGERIILMFEPTLFCSMEGFSGIIPTLYKLNMMTPEKQPDLYETIHSLLRAAHKEFLHGDAFKNLAIYAKIVELYIAISRIFARTNAISENNSIQGKHQEYIARLNAVFEYVEKHLSERISLEEVAKIANLSKFRFAHVFKEFTNQSFFQYLNWRRIKKAEILLLNPSLSINEIIQNSGFESIPTFYRVFKEVENCTPTEFKKKHLAVGEVSYSPPRHITS